MKAVLKPVWLLSHVVHAVEPGFRFWIWNTKPGGGADEAHVTVKVVDALPDVGAILRGTTTLPVNEGFTELL